MLMEQHPPQRLSWDGYFEDKSGSISSLFFAPLHYFAQSDFWFEYQTDTPLNIPIKYH